MKQLKIKDGKVWVEQLNKWLPLMKLNEKFEKLILEGKKKYEIRKLSKGYTTGYYAYVNLNLTRIMFIAKLTFLVGNPLISKYSYELETKKQAIARVSRNKKRKEIFEPTMWVNDTKYGVDKDTYNFVEENYANKHDFVCYKISEVKSYDWKKN